MNTSVHTAGGQRRQLRPELNIWKPIGFSVALTEEEGLSLSPPDHAVQSLQVR